MRANRLDERGLEQVCSGDAEARPRSAVPMGTLEGDGGTQSEGLSDLWHALGLPFSQPNRSFSMPENIA